MNEIYILVNLLLLFCFTYVFHSYILFLYKREYDMKYITLNELNNAVRTNMWKIPHDIEFVIGIPRSGMLPATIISEYLHIPLIDIDSFVNGCEPTGGHRLTMSQITSTNKVLVIDDTTYNGSTMTEAKEKLKGFSYEFIYAAVYLEGDNGAKHIDIYLEDVRKYTKQFPNVIYEHNIYHHYPHIMTRSMYDIDGVLCKEPPDERNTEEYEKYIANPILNIVPSGMVGKLVTYRLNKYRSITEKWLRDIHMQYGQLIMFNANSWKERHDTCISPAEYKATIYKADKSSILFVESDDWQARQIYEKSGKPVLSIEKNYLYGGE